MTPDVNVLQQKAGHVFKNTELLERALTHSSYANEKGSVKDSNERLEFLGDSVLGLISAQYFFTKYKDRPEGQLTKMRSAAVCEEACCGFAREIDLGNYLLLGCGEESAGGRERTSILADAFEAFIAAIYLDGGFDAAKQFVLPFIIESDEQRKGFTDYKTQLQEVVQENPEVTLKYVLASESGPDHDKRFTVEVMLDGNCIGKGTATTKKHAEQEAARQALLLMGL